MAIKRRKDGTAFDVTLRGRHVRRVHDEATATMLHESGKRSLELGKSIEAVIAELRGESTVTPTMNAYFERWLPLHSCKPQSLTCYRGSYNRAARFIGKTRLDAVDAAALKRLAGSLLEVGYAAHTIRQSVAIIKSMLNDACDDKLIADRPAKRIKNLPEAKAKREPFALTREQHLAIVQAAPPNLRAMFDLWPLIGCRRGEMVALEWDDWQEDRLWIRRQRTSELRVTKPKYDSVRRIDLCTRAIEILTEWRGKNPTHLVFPAGNGGYMGVARLSEVIAETGRAADVPDLHSHIYRHTAGSWWIASQCFSLPMVARMMGHRVEELVHTYTHEIQEADRGAMLRFDTWLGGEEGGTAKDNSRSAPT